MTLKVYKLCFRIFKGTVQTETKDSILELGSSPRCLPSSKDVFLHHCHTVCGCREMQGFFLFKLNLMIIKEFGRALLYSSIYKCPQTTFVVNIHYLKKIYLTHAHHDRFGESGQGSF